MASFDYIGEVRSAMVGPAAPGPVSRDPQPHLRMPRTPRRRPRWLGRRAL